MNSITTLGRLGGSSTCIPLEEGGRLLDRCLDVYFVGLGTQKIGYDSRKRNRSLGIWALRIIFGAVEKPSVVCPASRSLHQRERCRHGRGQQPKKNGSMPMRQSIMRFHRLEALIGQAAEFALYSWSEFCSGACSHLSKKGWWHSNRPIDQTLGQHAAVPRIVGTLTGQYTPLWACLERASSGQKDV